MNDKPQPTARAESSLTLNKIQDTAHHLSNWGRWGPDDELGTLNFVTPADIVRAASLIRRGKVFSLALDFNSRGPQNGLFGNRFNPIHTMTATGTDAVAGRQSHLKLRYADDMVTMPLQCGTQWDGLGHIFIGDRMWNGYPADLVTSDGAQKNGIEKTRNKMAGRGVLLDVARFLKQSSLPDGFAITCDHLQMCAQAQQVQVRRGDFVIVRTGHLERCLDAGSWGGYAGGDAPGFAFETCNWIHENEIAAICCDTWGCEVRPNESDEAAQPWHWVVIPMIGITMGEIFFLKELAEDCAGDGIYEFFFCAPALPITGAVGSPINPYAIK